METLTKEKLLEVMATDPTMGHDLDDQVIDQVCAHLVNGGSAVELAETWQIPWGHLSNWIHKSKERSKRFKQALNDRGEWSLESILAELRKLGLVRIGDIFDEDHCLLPPDEWPEGIAAAIAGIEVQELWEGKGDERRQVGVVKKVKFYDKGRALELLGRNLRAFTDKVEHEAGSTLEELIQAAAKMEKEEERDD